jgi:hypothetical protein
LATTEKEPAVGQLIAVAGMAGGPCQLQGRRRNYGVLRSDR